MRIDRDVEVAMRDGTVLRCDVWRADDGRPRPAVLIRTPYDRAGTNNDFLRPMDCVARDYACVVQDTRGRAGSGGEWTVLMPDQEGRDTHDSVEWIAGQPWCDGNVVMAGASYLGIVQLLGAAERPPHLRAIAPAMTGSAELDREYGGGATRLNEVVTWLAFMALDWLERERAAGRPADPAARHALWRLAADPTAALHATPPGKLPQFDIPGFPVDAGAMLAAGTPGIAESFRYAEIAVPALSVTGWFDNFCGQTIESFRRLRESGGGGAPARSAHRLIVGPWAHDGRLAYCQGEVSFTAEADPSVIGLAAQHIAFFDEHVRGAGTPTPAVRYFLMGADEWRTADAWPPPGTVRRTWYLDSGGHANTADGDGVLTPAPPVPPDDGGPDDHYDYDPADPVPTRGGRVVNLGRLVPGPLDRSHLERRADILCYTSPPLDADLDVVGPVQMWLYAASSATDTDFAARLVDVCPDGRALPVAEGIQRARHRAHPDGGGEGTGLPLVPGETAEFLIRLGHTAWRFPRGHRLRVEVTSSDFPAYDRNMNTGDPVGADGAADARGIVAHQTVRHTAEWPSRLEFGALESGDAS